MNLSTNFLILFLKDDHIALETSMKGSDFTFD